MKISEDISCKEYLLLEEEIQNNNTCQKLEEDARLPHTCWFQANVPNIVTEQYGNETSNQHKAGVANVGRLVWCSCSNNVFKILKNLHGEWEQNGISEMTLVHFLVRVLLLGLNLFGKHR